MSGLTYQFASWPDEDFLVAELVFDGEYVGHVVKRPAGLVVTLYPRVEVTFDLSTFESVLNAVRAELEALHRSH